MISVSTIAVAVCGLVVSSFGCLKDTIQSANRYLQTRGDKKVLKYDVAPAKTALADMEIHGCAIIRGSNQSQQSDLTFDSNWSFDEIDEFLRGVFPHVFTCADSLVQGSAGKVAARKAKPAWVLLSRERGKLLVPGISHPTGNDLDRFKGRTSAGKTDCHIYIGKLLRVQYIRQC